MSKKIPFEKNFIVFLLLFTYFLAQGQKKSTNFPGVIYTEKNDTISCFVEEYDNWRISYKLTKEDKTISIINVNEVKKFTFLSKEFEKVILDSTPIFFEIMEKGKIMFYRDVTRYSVDKMMSSGHGHIPTGQTVDEETYYIRTSEKDDCKFLARTRKKYTTVIMPYIEDNPEALRRLEKHIYGYKELYLLIAYYNKEYTKEKTKK